MQQQNSSSQNNNLRVYIGSSLLFLYILISVPVFAMLVIICTLVSFNVRYRISTLWATSILWVTKTCCGLSYQVEGLENLPNQAFIALCKHQSAWETLALRLILPQQTLVLKKSLTWIPFGGWALSTLKPIAIDRNNKRKALQTLIKQGSERLKDGLIVIIFPEGTRTAPGEDKKFQAGGAMLAHYSKYPAIPIAHNAGEFWPRNSFLKYPGTIKVKIGSAIETDEKKAQEINSEAAIWIANAMKEISISN